MAETEDAGEGRRRLLLEELISLRAELNATIDRMNGNENFSAGAVSAIFAFVLANDINALSVLMCALALMVSVVGALRYLELRRHAADLDGYLAAAETELSPKGGWSARFRDQIGADRRLRFAPTRAAFWLGIGALSLIGSAHVAAVAFG